MHETQNVRCHFFKEVPMRHLLFSLFFLALSVYAQSSLESDPKSQLTAIADRYENEFFKDFPEIGLLLGHKGTDLDRFRSHTLEAAKQWETKEDGFLQELHELDSQALTNSPQYITYRLLLETLENNKAARVCRDNLWKISPIDGWHIESTQLAEVQPVGTTENRAMALARWNNFTKIMHEEINNLKQGVNQGYTASQDSVRAVIKQIAIILNGPIEASPYFSMAERDSDEVFQNEIRHLIQTVIHPALQEFMDYLAQDYLPQARVEVGVSALPNGSACYQAKIKQNTTLDISPQEIHQFGLEKMKQLKKEVAEIGREQFNVEEMSLVYQLAMTKPEYLFKSEQDILDYNRAALARAQTKVHQWFSVMPTTPGIIRPYPEYRAKTGAAGEYMPPSEDGQSPGIFYVNTYAPERQSKVGHEATLFHELIPGHHFQIALQYENKTHHSIDKFLMNSGFVEGWALYVERLADEMGLYSDAIAKIGLYANESLRASRLVVDTGLHAFHWTRQQAIDYMRLHTAIPLVVVEGEVDRYIMLPAQANAYMLGKRQIELLKALAKERLKNRFDIREFHEHVLENGSVSLPLLQEKIEQWLDNSVKNHRS